MASELPQPLADLAARLSDFGLVLVDGMSGPGFGDEMIELSDGRLEVRFVRDRGQWAILLRDARWTRWFGPRAWEAALIHSSAVRPDAGAEADATLTLDDVARYRAAIDRWLPSLRVKRRLERLVEQDAARRFGWD